MVDYQRAFIRTQQKGVNATIFTSLAAFRHRNLFMKKKKKCSGTLSSILYFLILLFLGWPKIFILVILNSLLGEGTYSYLHSLSSKQEDEPQNMN